MATHEDQYKRAMGKRQWMMSTGAESEPDGPGTKVAILSPFLPRLIYDKRDRLEFYERQEATLVDHVRESGREPKPFMRATIDDFRNVLADTAFSGVIVTGWGNFSSIAVPLTRDEDDERFVHANWLQLTSMATHVKTGSAVMMQCLRYNHPNFNPPLFLGVVNSHTNILGNQGSASFAADTKRRASLPGPITTSENLTYAEIKDAYNYPPSAPMEQQRHVPLVPDRALNLARLARGVVRSQINNFYSLSEGFTEPIPEPSPPPDLAQYKQYFSEIDFAA